jgi:type I restriction enzyme S subunit
VTWPVVPLGEVAETALGKMLDKGRPRGHAHVPYLRNVNVQWGRIDTDDLLTMELADDERERFGVRKGDLLVCEGGEIGRCAIWHGRDDYLAYQKALHRIRPGDAVDARFLRYLLEHHSLSGTLAGMSTGTTIAHLPQQQLRRVPIPLPPLDEQRRIVELLEDHLSRLDAAGAYVRSATRRLANAGRSALDRLFGGRDVPLAELVDAISAGKSYGAATAPAAEDEWGIIKVSAMTWGTFDPAENKAVPSDRADPRFEIREGDLLVSRANTDEYVGASVLVGPVRAKLLLSDKSLRVSPADGVRPEWLWRALQAPSARRQISALATGTKDSMRNISQASLMRVRVPRATPQEQAATVGAYAEIAAALDRLRTELDSTRRRSTGLRRSLLAAAFSGRLTAETASA